MISLYIHIPFCERKCYFCSFVVSIGQEKRIDAYLECLVKEAIPYRGAALRTIYIGGGTPSLLQPPQLIRLREIIQENFQYSPETEMTIEANPEGLSRDKAEFLFHLGFNRVSLGVQSLNDRYLKFLGRTHDSRTAIQAHETLRQAGFLNINLDLMYGFPQQTNQDIIDDLQAIAALGSEHLSLYALTVEEHSRFFVKNLSLPEPQKQAKQYLVISQGLEKYGFRQYEISNFAKPGYESKHNRVYWIGGNYIGLGVGAHSHIDGRRFWNVPRLSEYMSRINKDVSPLEGEEVLSSRQHFVETVLFGLRMNEGVALQEMEDRFQCTFVSDQKKRIDEFIQEGFLKWEDGRLKASSHGRLLLDELCARLI
jgi:oxygen-independent coproporphyrinogen-3 oxidase